MKIIKFLLITTAIVFVVIFFGSIIYNEFIHKTPKEKLISEAENELKKSMNDPGSYEFVSFEEDAIKEMEDQKQIKELDMQEYNMNDRFFKLTYRGKNKIGALIIDEVYVKASNDDLFFLGLED